MLFGCCVNLLPEFSGSESWMPGVSAPVGVSVGNTVRSPLSALASLSSPGIRAVGAGYADALARLGYDYIELPLNRIMKLSESEFEDMRAGLAEIGLPCRCCNDFMPSVYRIVGEETTPWDELSRYLSGAFSRLERLGAPYTVFGSPWSRSCPDGFDRKRAFDQIAGFLRLAGHLAGEHGVTIAIEHNNHTETNMLNHFTDAVAMAKAVGLPQVRALCDYYHVRVEGDAPGVVLEGGDVLVHTHIAKLDGRGYFLDTEGESEFLTEYKEALREIGYEGGISIEARAENAEVWYEAAKENLRVLRNMFED